MADDTASLSVTSAKNLWHCLGACQTGGDVFAWVMRVKGVSFRHAYELLRVDPSLAAASAGAPIKQTTVRTLPDRNRATNRFTENGVDVLHVPVLARDGNTTIGTDLFVYKDDGRLRTTGQIVQFTSGVPVTVGSL